MKKYLLLFVWMIAIKASAQTVSGTVVLGDSKKPVALASVFFSNTSFGTVTNEEGQFVLGNLPVAKLDLIVSYLGYETMVTTIETDKQKEPLEIVLKPKPTELGNVVIEPYEKDNWERWGTFFIENFIGRSANANQCKIKNTQAISFRNYRRSQRLAAFSDEPLIIENKALGYRVKYQLEKFEYNFSTHVFFYQGFPLFEEMDTKPGRRHNNWEKRRLEAYNGSLTHFMRSLYRNQLRENNFVVRRMRRDPNLEKERIKLLMRKGAGAIKITSKKMVIGNNQTAIENTTDSSAYYNRILQQPDLIDLIDTAILPGDSIAFALDTTTAGLSFDHFLHITYLAEKEPFEYAQSQGRQKPLSQQISYMELLNDKILAIYSNGSFNPPTDVMLHAFWAFWEKIATMLPYDYKPMEVGTGTQ